MWILDWPQQLEWQKLLKNIFFPYMSSLTLLLINSPCREEGEKMKRTSF
jgi:hypothetical protein